MSTATDKTGTHRNEYPYIPPRVFLRFIMCVFFHRGSDINHCDTCHLDYWRGND